MRLYKEDGFCPLAPQSVEHLFRPIVAAECGAVWAVIKGQQNANRGHGPTPLGRRSIRQSIPLARKFVNCGVRGSSRSSNAAGDT
jgi:hypothetical protein